AGGAGERGLRRDPQGVRRQAAADHGPVDARGTRGVRGARRGAAGDPGPLRRPVDAGRPRLTRPGRGWWVGAVSAGSALAVLRRLAGLLQAGLLALLDPGVTGEEARLLQLGAVRLGVDLVQRTGDAQPQCPRLA